MTSLTPVTIAYFSDILCVWAYAAQRRLDELRNQFGSQINIQCHYIPVFGNTQMRIGEGWNEKGGFVAYGRHVRDVTKRFDYIDIHPDIWTRNIPPSSAGCHLLLKSIQLLEEKREISNNHPENREGRSLVEEAAWQMRLAFFRDMEDIAQLEVQRGIAERLGLPFAAIIRLIENGEAYAALCLDVELKDKYKIEGSPTFVLNDGRQKLYGNVGYRIIEVNVQELLSGTEDRASWC